MHSILQIMFSNLCKDLGLENYLANLASVAFIKRNEKDINSITEFITNNCGRCEKDSRTCDYLNPKHTVNISKEEILKMNFTLITQGQIKVCPQITVRR